MYAGEVTSGTDNQSGSPLIISEVALRFLQIMPSVGRMVPSPKEPTSFSIVYGTLPHAEGSTGALSVPLKSDEGFHVGLGTSHV